MTILDSTEVKFWGNLDVSLKEICEDITIEEKCIKKLFNKLKDLECWEIAIKIQFNSHSDLYTTLSQIFHSNKTLFFQIFATKVFSDKILDNQLIIDKATKILAGDKRKIIPIVSDDPKCLVLPIFLTNPDAIVDLFYENLITKFNIKTFYAMKETETKKPLMDITKDTIQKLLNKYDNLKKKRIKRKSHVWWVISDGDQLKIYFRREKRAATAIKFVTHNEFIKTADAKILIFSENGNRLDAGLGREPTRSLAIADFLAQQLFDPNISYEEKIMEFSKETIFPFVNAIKAGDEKIAKILEIRVKNAPLEGSPIVEIRSSVNEPINKNIRELEKKHNLLLISDSANILNATVLIDDIPYKLHFNVKSETVVITCSNRGYRDEEKKNIERFFESILS
jgi:hypothetical protein